MEDVNLSMGVYLRLKLLACYIKFLCPFSILCILLWYTGFRNLNVYQNQTFSPYLAELIITHWGCQTALAVQIHPFTYLRPAKPPAAVIRSFPWGSPPFLTFAVDAKSSNAYHRPSSFNKVLQFLYLDSIIAHLLWNVNSFFEKILKKLSKTFKRRSKAKKLLQVLWTCSNWSARAGEGLWSTAFPFNCH